MIAVLVRGLEFYAYHGVPAEERAIGHRYSIDLDIQVEGNADETDEIADTVDYGAVAQTVIAVGQGCQCKTVEKLTRKVGERILADYSRVSSLTITLVKRLPPAPIHAEEAGVRLTLTR